MRNIFLSIPFVFFSLWSSSLLGQNTDNNELTPEYAAQQMQKIERKELWVDNLSLQNITSLPIGIKTRKRGENAADNATYSIGIIKATLHSDYTELQVFAKVDIPQKGDDGRPISLFFGANNIKLSHSGGIIGDAKLALLGDVAIPIHKDAWQLTLYGGFNKQTGQTEDLTYAVIDCDGFKEFRLSGAVEFSRELILPIENGMVNEAKQTVAVTLSNGRVVEAPNRVRGDFSITASAWNDLIMNVSLSPFVLAKKQNGRDYDGNFQFLVSKAVLDVSDIKNDPSVVFPNMYNTKGLLFPAQESWKGVYVENFSIGLPSEFKTKSTAENGKRIEFSAKGLLIDKFGVSGVFSAENIFPLKEGITDKNNAWAYSLEHIEVQIETGEFVKANFNGKILLPITNASKNKNIEQLGLQYDGLISEERYSLNVTTTDEIQFDLWQAKASLYKNSSIELKVENNRFLPKAVLHGNINFAANKTAEKETQENQEESKTVDFKGITFENLKLQTVSPMISVGNMRYKNEVSFSNFPVSIKSVEVRTLDNRADVYFDVALNLMDKSELSARANIGILGELTSENHTYNYKFKGLDLSAIAIKGSFCGFSMDGRLDLLENHPIYGNGFNADLKVEIKGACKVKAKAIFGKKEFRYWYFDASAKISTGYFINGFGGGAYYNMKRNALADPAEFSPSGLTYEPYQEGGLGLKALVSFAIGSDKAFNGEAAFEMLFNKNGGLDFAAIYGKGNVLADIPGIENIQNLVSKVSGSLENKASFLGLETNNDKRTSFEKRFLPLAEKAIPTTPDNKATIQFKTAIQFDIANQTTHGTLDVYINAGFISGVGEGGRAGWAVFHKDPKDWYLYIGTPDDRVGIKMGVAGVSLKTTSYLMAGTKLPASPPPPPNVASILGVQAQELNYMRDENALANAGGFAFGSDLSIDTGDLSFLIFYANFKAGVGFDIMLKNYGEASCRNTGKQVGIDGWYANGQSYAYLQGELGVRVKLLFINMRIPIISAGAAVLMQAKLPNPVWLRGYVGGEMNVLGGLIKGKFNFKVTIGEQCDFGSAGGAFEGMKLIADVSPKNNSNDVDVFAVPQATFSMKVNEPFEIPEDNGKSTYRVVLEKFNVLDDKNQEVKGRLEWSHLKDRANFIPEDILAPQKKFKVQVEVSFQKQEGGIFRPITQNGQVAKEFEERTFTTGTAPNYIPLQNIEYAYPVVSQKFFLKDEFEQGYVKLKQGQDYLFEGNQWENGVKIIDNQTHKAQEVAFVYNNDANEITFAMPKLQTKSVYKVSFFSKPVKTNTKNEKRKVTENVKRTQEEGNDYEVLQKQAQSLSKEGEIERLTYDFSTSKYKTFNEKIKAIKVSHYNFIIQYSDVISLANNLQKSEPFEVVDLVGNEYSKKKPLIAVEATLQDAYFKQYINPTLYSQLPIAGKYQLRRDTKEWGLIPSKAISIDNKYLTNVQNEIFSQGVENYFPYQYDLALAYKMDFVDIINQISNDVSKGIVPFSSPVRQFLKNTFTPMRKGDYYIKLIYTLPGDKKSSEALQMFKNPIDD